MLIENHEPNVFSWVDVSTPDVAASAAFYSGLFGWDVQVGAPEFGGYATAMVKGSQVAGISPQMPMPEGAPTPPPSWNTYVNVDSVDDTAAKVKAAGGTLYMEPMDVGDLGRMAFLADPNGGALGLWQPAVMKGAGLVNEPGAFAWNELMTRDIDGSKAFYGAVFGWEADTHDSPDGGYTEWKANGRTIGGMMTTPPMIPAGAPPIWNVYFAVEDTDITVAKAQELGGSVLMGAMDIPQGRMAVLADPNGAGFSVIALNFTPAGS